MKSTSTRSFDPFGTLAECCFMLAFIIGAIGVAFGTMSPQQPPNPSNAKSQNN